MSLHPAHLADLRASGLSDDTIAMMEVYSLEPRNVLALPDPIVFRTESCLAFPYFDNGQKNNFVRYKLFPPYVGKDGAQKYWQPSGSKPHAYILPVCVPKLSDPDIPIWIIEGEKKTAKAVEDGKVAIGIQGIWSWVKPGSSSLLDDFKTAEWASRRVYIVPDSDTWNNTSKANKMKDAAYALGRAIKNQGAMVRIVKILE